jgi:NitT/TauT family transport system substrate-binding protein
MCSSSIGYIAGLLVILVGCNSRPNSAPEKTGDNKPAASETQAAATDGKSLIPVKLQLNWLPEMEHGGFYAAQVAGFYEREGLDVTIIAGGPETPVTQLVVRGAVTFGIANADNILFSRAQQAPVVAVMAPLQNSPRCIMVHAAAGIRTFEDLKDMTLAMSNTQAYSFYLRKKVPLTGVRIVPYSGGVATFMRDPKYGQQAYVFSEPFVAKQAGGDPQTLMMSELGFNPYTSLVFASEDTIAQQPELVRKMVRATVAGWQRYLDDPEPTNKLIHSLNSQMGMDILAFGVEAIRPLVQGTPDAGTTAAGKADATKEGSAAAPAIGRMTRERWQELLEQIIWCGQLKEGDVKIDEVFTTQFLPQ